MIEGHEAKLSFAAEKETKNSDDADKRNHLFTKISNVYTSETGNYLEV